MNPLKLAKVDAYYDWPREEVLEILKRRQIKATNAIELGCSSGRTGAKIKQQLGIRRYVGIDVHPDSAGEASRNLDEIHIADIETASPGQIGLTADQGFDLLVGLDVLEHLKDPWDVLAAWTELLQPGGHVILSIPNVQHFSVVADLIQGDWKYESAGLLDATHLRFFTQRSIEELLKGAGLMDLFFASVLRPEVDLSTIKETGNFIKSGNFELKDLTRKQMIGLCTFQYVAIGRKPF